MIPASKVRTDVRETWLEGVKPSEWLDYLFESKKWLKRLEDVARDPYLTRTEMGQLLEDSMESFLESKREQDAEDTSNALRIGVVDRE